MLKMEIKTCSNVINHADLYTYACDERKMNLVWVNGSKFKVMMM